VHAGSAQDDTSILLSFRDAQTKVTGLGYGNMRSQSMFFHRHSMLPAVCLRPCSALSAAQQRR